MPGRRDSGPLVGYERGPTKRVEAPGALGPRGTTAKGSKPDAAMGPSIKTAPSSGSAQGKGVQAKGANTKAGKGLGKSGRADPKASKEILVATKFAGRATEIATGAAVGSIGGVYAGGFRGGLDLDDDWVCDSWGWDDWSCNWGYSAWCWWSFPCYWSWYYPCWYWYSRPYYYYDYAYYTPISTVVYAEPEVIYVERSPAGNEPVGEAVASLPAQPAGQVAAPAPGGLSIAAQRYLELGDRAFREGRYADAVQFYAKAVEFAPDQGALYLVLADALFAAGDYHYGAYAVRRALELDPALVDSQIDKHAFYPDPAHFDEQLAALERYLGDHPSDRDARLVLALNYLFGGRARDAVRTIDSSVSAMADDAAAQKILARARVLARD